MSTTSTSSSTSSSSTTTTTTTTMPQYCYLDDILHYVEAEELARLSNDRDFIANDTLNSPITSSSTTIILHDANTFLNSGTILIDSEEISYTSKNANVLSGLTRGVNYTVASAHNDLSTVVEVLTINTSNINYCVRDAGAEIEQYLGTVYTNLPFTSIPLSIRKATIDIAIYNLYCRRKSIPPQWLNQYNKQIAFLIRLQKGEVVLDSTDTNSKIDRILTNTYAADLTFTTGSPTLGTVGTLDSY